MKIWRDLVKPRMRRVFWSDSDTLGRARRTQGVYFAPQPLTLPM
jgi:hypothetical protein